MKQSARPDPSSGFLIPILTVGRRLRPPPKPTRRSRNWARLAASLLLPTAALACQGIDRPATQASLSSGAGVAGPAAPSERTSPASAGGATTPEVADALARIREEGLQRSQVMNTLDYLTNIIGPRLTSSPQLHRANLWAKQQLTEWGLSNAHLHAWGPFGRGWTLESFSMQVTEPDTIILNGYPRAWSPGFDEPWSGEIVHLTASNEAELDAFRGRLHGKIVLIGDVRRVDARFEPLATRLTDAELERLAGATGDRARGGVANPSLSATTQPTTTSPETPLPGQARADTPGERAAAFADTPAGRALRAAGQAAARAADATSPATAPAATRPAAASAAGAARFAQRKLNFAHAEGARLIVTPSTRGDGGTLFVQSAAVVNTDPDARSRPWLDGAIVPPQVMLAVEDFNRLARMLQRGVSLTAKVDLRVRFHDDHVTNHNVIADIPGTDLAHELVMVGAHIDSWHSSTGTTDNAVGVAAAMEAVRILQAAGVRPRRTIRIGLWSGEEQGLLGSRAYVGDHFARIEGPANGSRRLIKKPAYDHLSVYFNLDNGTGRIRGIYAQGNRRAAEVFRAWLQPLHDLAATTVTLSNTGSTDHASFDAVGLPGFQFIQDPVEYFTRTWHSNQDNFDRAQADDLKQAATVMASFLYRAAMTDDKLPRKPLPANVTVVDAEPVAAGLEPPSADPDRPAAER